MFLVNGSAEMYCLHIYSMFYHIDCHSKRIRVRRDIQKTRDDTNMPT